MCLRRAMKIIKVDSIDDIHFPTFMVPKYDGIRVLRISDVWLDENKRPLPRELLPYIPDAPDGVDAVFRSHRGGLVVYDYLTPISCAYNLRERLQLAKEDLAEYQLQIAPAYFVKSVDKLKQDGELHWDSLTCYFRSPSSRYIQSRFTKIIDQAWLEYDFPFYKYATIIELVVRKVKVNRAGKLETVDDMAGMIVEDEETKHQFLITGGYGLSKGLLWRNRNYLVGKQIKYSCNAVATSDTAPRNPHYVMLCDELINQIDREKL